MRQFLYTLPACRRDEWKQNSPYRLRSCNTTDRVLRKAAPTPALAPQATTAAARACFPSPIPLQTSGPGASRARPPVPPRPQYPAPGGAYRDQGAATAVLLLSARRLAVQPVGSAPLGAPRGGGGRRGRGRRRRRGRLPVFAGPLGLGLQAALVQGEGLLALQLQALRGHGLVAGLAGAVVPPAELDAPAEPLHHRAVPRHHELRHGAGGQHHGPGGEGAASAAHRLLAPAPAMAGPPPPLPPALPAFPTGIAPGLLPDRPGARSSPPRPTSSFCLEPGAAPLPRSPSALPASRGLAEPAALPRSPPSGAGRPGPPAPHCCPRRRHLEIVFPLQSRVKNKWAELPGWGIRHCARPVTSRDRRPSQPIGGRGGANSAAEASWGRSSARFKGTGREGRGDSGPANQASGGGAAGDWQEGWAGAASPAGPVSRAPPQLGPAVAKSRDRNGSVHPRPGEDWSSFAN